MDTVSNLPRFHWADYVVFTLIIMLSCGVGIYYAIQDKRAKRNTVEDFLLAGRSMNVFPVSMSMFVSWLSAISFMGDPVEAYYQGSVYLYLGLGYCLGIPLAAEVFAPRFHRMKVISIYEYLEKRFNRTVRLAASLINTLAGTIYSGVALYAPAIALAQVTGFNPIYPALFIGILCIIYTSMGGMKAVVWVDTIQTSVMFLGIFLLVVRGVIAVGGLENVFILANQNGRINFNKFNPSPFVRSTFWTYLIGGYFRTFNPYTASQTWIQRYLTLPTVRDVKLSLYFNIPLYAIFGTMFCMVGLLLVAYFNNCDPLVEGRIQRVDQLVPLMMMELLGFMPGAPGLFLACLFCASLSSMSSAQNATATVLLEDIASPCYRGFTDKNLTSTRRMTLAKIFSVCAGTLSILVAVAILFMEDPSVFQITLKVTGGMLGPKAALFWVGLFIPFVDTASVLIGFLFSTSLGIWLLVGPMIIDVRPADRLPTNADGCMNTTGITGNLTYDYGASYFNQSTVNLQNDDTGLVKFYQFSPMLLSALGSISTVIISVTLGGISALLCRMKKKIKKKDMELAEQDVQFIPEKTL